MQSSGIAFRFHRRCCRRVTAGTARGISAAASRTTGARRLPLPIRPR
jgi:hypothetical protein